MPSISAVLGWIRRNKGRFALGATVVGGIYVLKKVLDSDLFAELFDALQENTAADTGGRSTGTSRTGQQHLFVSQTLSEARQQYVFETHQQICDKVLSDVIGEVSSRLKARFNTEELIEGLRVNGLSTKEKLESWEELKIRSVARVLGVAYTFPLLTLAFKLQRSILCHEIEKAKTRDSETRTKPGILGYISSFFSRSDTEVEDRNLSNSRTQQIFNNCLNFLTDDGVDRLLNLIEQLTRDEMELVKLNDSMNGKTLQSLLGSIAAKLEDFTGEKNFSDLVIPTYQISNTSNQMVDLKRLFMHLTSALESKRCKIILSESAHRYFNYLIELIEKNMKENVLPLAKLIPMITNMYSKIVSTRPGSIFHSTLNSPEFYQFTLVVFTCLDDLPNYDFMLKN